MTKVRDAWFKFHPRDYLDKTRSLSLEQRGAYMDCICIQMMTEAPLPDNFAWLGHQLHVSSRKAKSIIEGLLEECKLRRTAAGIVNDRCVTELEARALQRQTNAENAANCSRKLAENAANQAGTADENSNLFNQNNRTEENSLIETASTRARVDTREEKEKKRSKAPDGAVRDATETKGSRLPKDWQLPDLWRAWALEHHQIESPQTEQEAKRFRDYWVGIPGQKGRKSDWEGTWRNWVRRNYAERSINGQPPDVKRPPDFWWRDRPDTARRLPVDVWRKAVTNFANGHWPVETLGPPPGDLECLVPGALIDEMHLAEIYDEHGAKRS